MSYGQMLAAAQAFATPEQQRKVAQTQSQGADFEVKKEKKSQMEELQAMMEAELKRASNKGGFFKNLGNLGKVLGFIPGVGTLASGLIGGIAGAGQAGAAVGARAGAYGQNLAQMLRNLRQQMAGGWQRGWNPSGVGQQLNIPF